MFTYLKMTKATFQFSGKIIIDSRNGTDLTGSPSGRKKWGRHQFIPYPTIKSRWVWVEDLTVSKQVNMCIKYLKKI